MQSRRKILAAIVIGGGLSAPAYAQLGSLGSMLGGGRPSGGGDATAQVADFIRRSSVLSALSGKALAKINSAFESEEALARRRKEQDELSKITDPQEKQSRAAKIYESESAAADKLAKSADLQERMKNLDADKKKSIGEGLFNFAIGAPQAPGLIKAGQGIVQGVGVNPAEIAKVVPVKDALPTLVKIGSDGGSTIAALVKVAQGANISVPQATAESKPVDTQL